MVPDNHATVQVYRSLDASTIVIKFRLRRQSEEQFEYMPFLKRRQLKRPGWQKIPHNDPITVRVCLVTTGTEFAGHSIRMGREFQRHTRELAACPTEWMPWNYRETLARNVQLLDSAEL
jgi:hypothetical protein